MITITAWYLTKFTILVSDTFNFGYEIKINNYFIGQNLQWINISSFCHSWKWPKFYFYASSTGRLKRPRQNVMVGSFLILRTRFPRLYISSLCFYVNINWLQQRSRGNCVSFMTKKRTPKKGGVFLDLDFEHSFISTEWSIWNSKIIV